jgi:hypothetical protein
VVDHLLERSAGSPTLSVQELGHVVIKGKSGSHIMMLIFMAS